MRVVVSLMLYLVFAPLAHGANVEPIGVLTNIQGPVQILRAENYLAAVVGVDVMRDDIIETGKNAAAQLDMEDGSVLSLGPETRLALSDYRLDSNKSVLSAAIDVLSGWMRFAVAKVKPDRSYNIRTPVLTIGVRGTEGTIEAQNERGGLHLNEGAVDVTPVGTDLKEFHPVRVNGGEYVQRERGRPLAKQAQPPEAFHKRLPPGMQQKLAPKVRELHQRGVPPRVIRRMTQEDAKRFLERHPNMHPDLHQRFRGRAASAPRVPHPYDRNSADPRLVDKLQQKPAGTKPSVADPRRVEKQRSVTEPKQDRPADRQRDDDDGPDRRQSPPRQAPPHRPMSPGR